MLRGDGAQLLQKAQCGAKALEKSRSNRLKMMEILYGVLLGCLNWLNCGEEKSQFKKSLILITASIVSYVFGFMAARGVL